MSSCVGRLEVWEASWRRQEGGVETRHRASDAGTCIKENSGRGRCVTSWLELEDYGLRALICRGGRALFLGP
jgi:hypothetical protein